MTLLLDQRDDGSLALYIDGDLQFDSRDERIYHEALALPALALAQQRHNGPLRALICGGGDGLAARELLKSQAIARIDLVDYDQAILDMARTELAELNQRSLDHLAVHTYAEDARGFVDRAIRAGRHYDLVVCDLTVPQDRDGALLHTVAWYRLLAQVITPDCILAVNAISPSAASEAYWAVYNSLRAAGFAARPYRIALPSFAANGYGDDWGFFVASLRSIEPAELNADLPLAEPRTELHSATQLRRLFTFPASVAELRASAVPIYRPEILLHYIYNTNTPGDVATSDWDGLAFTTDPIALPDAETTALLPADVRAALAGPHGSRADEEALLAHVLDLMPALQRDQTRDMIATFLADPARFLSTLDLRALVDQLLRRTAELPRRLVAELRLLRARLRTFVGDHTALLYLGMRIVTIVTIVIIVANMAFPDAIYGKGGGTGSNPSTGDTISLSRPSQGAYNPSVPPDLATGGGFRDPNYGRGVVVDEGGSMFPTRRYRYFPRYYGRGAYGYYRSGQRPAEPVVESEAAYRLTPETDILPDGKVVIFLNESAYLLLDDEAMSVVDQQNGMPMLFLEREPAQLWRAAKEIDRQRLGLQQSAEAKQRWINWIGWMEFAPWTEDDRRELTNLRSMTARLEIARQSLGIVPNTPPSLPQSPLAGAIEAFSGVWMLPDGSALALRLPGGETAYMDGKQWYSNRERTTPRADPYPANFKTMFITYLNQQIKDRDAISARLAQALKDANTDLATLQKDLAEYQGLKADTRDNELVEYGTIEIPLAEALRRTNDDIARTQQRVAMLQAQIINRPAEHALMQRIVANLGQ